jgi:alkylation response protein AidB-like acyl-CoA dehydrogenase
MAHRALQEIASLAPTRKRRDVAFPTVGDQPTFQAGLALLDVELKAMRTYLHATAASAVDYVTQYGGPLPPSEGREVQQLGCLLHDVCIRCVDFAYAWSGSTGLRRGHIIGRLFRNMHAINQHVIVDRNLLVEAAPGVMEDLTKQA